MKKFLSVCLILLVSSAFTTGLITNSIEDSFLNTVIPCLYVASLLLMVISLIAKEEGFGTTFFICSLVIPFTDILYCLCAGHTFNDLMANSDPYHYNMAFGEFGWKEYVIVSIIIPVVLALIVKIIVPSKPVRRDTARAREADIEVIG